MADRFFRYTLSVTALFLLPHILTAAEKADTLRLKLLKAVFLEGAGVYNLSGMALSADGWLYLSDDNGPAPPGWEVENPVLLRLKVDSLIDPKIAVPHIEALEIGQDAFARLAKQTGKMFKYDLEGVAVADKNRLWAIDERDRLLLEYDLSTGSLTCLAGPEELLKGQDDLASGRINNGFEGITVIGKRLFLAHEMFPNLIASYRLNGKLEPGPRITLEGSSDINGLDLDRGFLYALARTGSMIYKINPENGQTSTVAEFRETADSSAYRYQNPREYYRNSEGLAVKGGYIFVVCDGNGKFILGNPDQRAPLVLIFKRPETF